MTDHNDNRRWDWVGDILEVVGELLMNVVAEVLWVAMKGCAQILASFFDGL